MWLILQNLIAFFTVRVPHDYVVFPIAYVQYVYVFPEGERSTLSVHWRLIVLVSSFLYFSGYMC